MNKRTSSKMSNHLKLLCIQRIASVLHSKISQNSSFVTCCHCLHDIKRHVDMLIEQDTIVKKGKRYFSPFASRELRIALDLLIYEQFTKKSNLFHECFVSEIFDEKISKFNPFLVVLKEEIRINYRKRQLYIMFSVFVETYFVHFDLKKRQAFVSDILSDSNINDRYFEARDLHRRILNTNDQTSNQYEESIKLLNDSTN